MDWYNNLLVQFSLLSQNSQCGIYFEKLTLEHACLPVFRFFSCRYHSTIALYTHMTDTALFEAALPFLQLRKQLLVYNFILQHS
jgi:hypothetical protein